MALRRAKNAGRRPDVEAWLDEYAVEWEYFPQVELDEFDFDRGLRNQARVFTQLDESTVEVYAEAVKRGDVFPAVVAARTGNRNTGKLTIVDGNHRLFANKRAGDVPIDVYVVKAAPQTMTLMSFAANARHGLPARQEERLRHAVWMIDNGASQENAAATMNVKVADVQRAYARQRADRRADEVGLLRSQWDNLNATIRQRLQGVATDEGFRAAATLVFRAGLGVEETVELITEVNSTRSAAKQVGIVKKFEEVYRDRIQANAGGIGGGNYRRAQTPKSQFRRALTLTHALPENLDLLVDTFAEEERRGAAKEAREAARTLTALAKKLEASAL